jgi:soluble lytic murein transglycosylase
MQLLNSLGISIGGKTLALAGLCLALGTGASANDQAAKSTSLTGSVPSPSQLQLQRNQFMAAEDALKQKRIAGYRQLVEKLGDYPLKPYLEYSELRRRLYLFPHADVDDFLATHAGSYLGDRMAKEWLETLARQRKWEDYRKYFLTANLNSDELRCYDLRARFNTGDEAALEAVAELWNVGHSQPDACDPLFKVWIERGYLSDTLAWERHSKAIAQRNLSLSRYIAGKMSPEMKRLADLYYEVDRHPERLKNHQRFGAQTPEIQEIILHGIRRYARKDPLKALKHWLRYDAKHQFPGQDRSRTQEYLVTQLAVEGHMMAAQQVLDQTGEVTSSEVIAWLVRDALRNQDWQRAYRSIAMLPAEEQQSERWLYWRARALEQLGIEDPEYPSAEQIYANLALTRTFYGFLSADMLGHEYNLIDRPVNPPSEHMDMVMSLPAMRRAKELLDLGRTLQARREWFYAVRGLEPVQLLAAGKLAEEWGWYRKSIQAMIEANYWDDLQLRFPLAYLEEMNTASASTDIDSTFLYAIARQESAFAADARSPAGAMGLMQLLPATAKRTAQTMGMKYSYWDLINPSQNIQLGSRYLDQLLKEFNGNRVLAAAAYNAGPYRVKKWLAETDEQLPYDIWIETIPFWETRGYVQNVLAYSVIYGYRMGKQVPMLGDETSRGVSLLQLGGE